MKWLISSDRINSDVNSAAFAQRYVIAVLYFSLCPEGWAETFRLSPFQHECEISGVTCHFGKRITSLKSGKIHVYCILPH